jgi:hypothetical protein
MSMAFGYVNYLKSIKINGEGECFMDCVFINNQNIYMDCGLYAKRFEI